MNNIPQRQIRAVYDEKIIRVYQAYSDAIADSAIEKGTFVSPPFKMERMTWIKPSFLWMMYRSGWGKKDAGQKRILAIDITREGFEWALKNSCISRFEKGVYASEEEWHAAKNLSPVRIQWDPDRDIYSQPLEYRTIQIGLSREAVELYAYKWIQNIEDISKFVSDVNSLIQNNQINESIRLLPKEIKYTIPPQIKKLIGIIDTTT